MTDSSPPTRPAALALGVTRLPCEELVPDWERIFLPEGLPERLLRYLDLLVWLGQTGAAPTALALQRALLFFGPFGCGKSSVVRGLPNAWARDRHQQALLVALDAHSLPSAERGGTQRNVRAAFARIAEVASTGMPTFVTVDEVETLATDRASVNPTTNPLDTLYGVNAFIESKDACVREHSNVVFLYTSNLPRFIDRAISERVDFSEFIPLPDLALRQRILADALSEVAGAGQPLVALSAPTGYDARLGSAAHLNGTGERGPLGTKSLVEVARLTEGFSARELRHLVVLALVLAGDPSHLNERNLVDAAQHQIALRRHHEETGGTYGYAYQH